MIGALVDNLVDEGQRIIVFWTFLVHIVKVCTNANSPLFLGNGDEIGNP